VLSKKTKDAEKQNIAPNCAIYLGLLYPGPGSSV